MAVQIRFRRDVESLLPASAAPGEPLFTTDSHKFYIGTGTGVAQIGAGTATSVDVSGGTTGLTFSGGPITGAGTITLAGTLAVANGGTGATTAAAARTNLGLGTLATQSGTFSGTSSGTNTGDVTVGGQSYLSITGQAITAGQINLAGTHVTGTLPRTNLPAAASAQASHSSSQTATNNAWTTLTLNTDDWDTDNFHDPATNSSRITIPSGLGGKYFLFAAASFFSNSTGFRAIRFLKNGATEIGRKFFNPVAGVSTLDALGIVAPLAAGDYVEVQVYQTSGAGLSVESSAGVSPVFSATFLGA